jgi:hypothetical protein
MQPRRYSRLALLLCAFVAAACGGSGSSGFDALPSGENAAINLALAEQHCVDFEGLSVCPANQATATVPPGTPTPTRTAGPLPTASPAPLGASIDIPTGMNGPVTPQCLPSAPACSFAVPFAPQGFPPTALFRVAVRRDMEPGWIIGAEPESRGSPSAPSFDATVSVDVTPASIGASVQVAVLVFLHEPAADPGEIPALAVSGADFAFVTPEFQIQVPRGL